MKRTPMTRKVKKPITKAKNAAWMAFSRMIRTRDCLRTTGVSDRGECVSCGKLMEFGKLQAGHWIAGRRNSILFDERGVHGQCFVCNCRHSGKMADYSMWMLDTYGREVMDELVMTANTVSRKFTTDELDYMRREFDRRTEAMIDGRERAELPIGNTQRQPVQYGSS